MLGFYPIAGQNLYIVGSPMVPEYTIHLSNGKDLKVVREGVQWKQMFITHDVLINGGKLVFPHSSAVEKVVDKASKPLNKRRKRNSHFVNNLWINAGKLFLCSLYLTSFLIVNIVNGKWV